MKDITLSSIYNFSTDVFLKNSLPQFEKQNPTRLLKQSE